MTLPVNNIRELALRLQDYLLQDRPLNLDEMRNAFDILSSLIAIDQDIARLMNGKKFTPNEEIYLGKLRSVIGRQFS